MKSLRLIALALLSLLGLFLPRSPAQTLKIASDPLAEALHRPAQAAPKAPAVSRTPVFEPPRPELDPIKQAQVMAAAETAFPKLSADLENADLFRRALGDPSMRGNLRGRLAEHEFQRQREGEGWKPHVNKIDQQVDFERHVNGKLERAQVKTHDNWKKYLRSMNEDHEAERFVIPDDHYELVYKDLEERRIGALRGAQREAALGNIEQQAAFVQKAADYAHKKSRLTKLGRTFGELDGALESTGRYWRVIAPAMRRAGKAVAFIGIALNVMDGAVAVQELASGKARVADVAKHASKAAIGWLATDGAVKVLIATEVLADTGVGVPIVASIVIGAAVYWVVDLGIDATARSIATAQLTTEEIKRLYPPNHRGLRPDPQWRKILEAMGKSS